MAEYINWNVKERDNNFGWKYLSCSIKLEELQKIVNEKGYCNFNLNPRKDIGKYGETHSITKNDWKPKEQESEEPMKTVSYGNARSKEEEIDILDIPF